MTFVLQQDGSTGHGSRRNSVPSEPGTGGIPEWKESFIDSSSTDTTIDWICGCRFYFYCKVTSLAQNKGAVVTFVDGRFYLTLRVDNSQGLDVSKVPKLRLNKEVRCPMSRSPAAE